MEVFPAHLDRKFVKIIKSITVFGFPILGPILGPIVGPIVGPILGPSRTRYPAQGLCCTSAAYEATPRARSPAQGDLALRVGST